MKKVCSDCGKSKQLETKTRCSGCNRKFKRRTRPKYYLRTCWLEIKRRCTKKVPNRDYVAYGKDFCTKEEFVERFLTDEKFLRLYKIWQENNYERGIAPSIDRIDETKGYTLDNLQFLSNSDNAKKSFNQSVTLRNVITGEEIKLQSQTMAAEYLGISQPYLSRLMKENKLIKKTYKARWKK
jgi:hypothetical protein